MIEHADAALDAWLATLDPAVDVTFDRVTDAQSGSAKRPLLSLVLTSVREQNDKRDNQVSDVRGDGGRVVARRRATRFFELDYQCAVAGPAREAHRALGDLVQLLVDHDVVPAEHVPAELGELGHPIDVQLVASAAGTAAITLRVVLPVEPTPEREIAPPATSLHLDMTPPPEPRRAGSTGGRPAAVDAGAVPMEDRKWTTVRRRELIGRQAGEAAKRPGR